MTPSEKYLMHRLGVAEDAVRRGLIRPSANRTRYLSELAKKAASGFQTEGERLREAELAMEASRKAARDELLGHSATPRPAPHAGALGMMASAAQQAAGADRVRAERDAWRAQAAARETRRLRMVAATTGGEVGAHERGLRAIIKSNGGFG